MRLKTATRSAEPRLGDLAMTTTQSAGSETGAPEFGSHTVAFWMS